MARNLLLGTALQTGLAFLSGVGAHPAHAQPAPNARPAGGTVVAGSASISRTPANTQINQSSPRAAIDWRSFDVGAQQSVTFAQPSASAVALNRVTGPDPSQIAGRIDANGQFILVNQSGVTFYKGAQVNAAGVMVSAANITNQNFMAGSLTFDQAGRNPNARIDNRGSITVREAGLAALVAPQVANSGVITARLGHVVLAGAKTATLDLYGDGLLSLDVSNQVTQAPVGADGKAATALVTNTGVIVADGGTVQLTARAADGLVQTLVQAGGTIQAASVGARTGVVALSGVGGSVVVEGQLSAPGSAPGTTGGAVQVVADHDVTVAGSARIDASGQAGGGVVALGTTLNRARGGPGVTPAMTAANTTIQAGARVSANAAAKGDGGRVVVLSKAATRMEGQIAARGGPTGGNGGFAEVSGDRLGMAQGRIDLSAPLGTIGSALLDPRDLDIVAAGTGDSNVVGGGLPVGAPDQATDLTVSAAALTELRGNLLIEASRNLKVDAPLAFNQGLGTLVTMLAGNDLTVNQAITTQGGSLTLRAAVQTDGTTTFDGFNPAGALRLNAAINTAGPLTAGTGNITLSAGTGGITIGANITGLTVDLSTAGGGIRQNAGQITAVNLQSATGVVGDVSLSATTNAITNFGDFTVRGGDLAVVNASDLTLFGTVSAANLFFEVGAGKSIVFGIPAIGDSGAIPVNLTATATGGRISLVADTFAVADPTSANSIVTTAGTVEFAPATPGGTLSLGGTASGVEADVLALINTNGGTLEVGAFTNVPGGGGRVVQAGSITIDGPVDLTGKADTLRLDTTGDITEDTELGSLTVTNLAGSAVNATLNSFGNVIDNLGNFTTSGNLALVSEASLTITGPVIAGGVSAPDPGNTATLDLTTFGSLKIGVANAAVGIINAGTVSLQASGGSITEPNGAIGANSFSARASTEGSADVLLTSRNNKIAVSTGITAGGGGDVVLVDDPTLLLTGNYIGNNLFFEVTLAGGSLQLGDATATAALNASQFGRISLVADAITVGNASSTITVPFGTVELAPFSAIHTSVAGTSAAGQLLIDPTLLSIINGGTSLPTTLRIGGFTDVTGPTVTGPAASTTGITIDGPVDLTNTAFGLNLLAKGSITEPGGPITVTEVSGSSVGTFSLANPANAIAETAGITAVGGDVVVVSQTDLELLGAHNGNNLFFEVARAGGALAIGNGDSNVSLNAVNGGRISLVADQITDPFSVGTISAPAGTLELAPFSAINTSVNGTSSAGQLLIDGQLLSAVTSALNTLVIGGFTNAPAGATASAPSAGSVTIDGALDLAPLATTLNLEALGAVTQAAPILNVGTLLGTTGSTALTNPGNTVATLGNYAATSGLAITNAADLLIAGAVTTGGTAAFTITGNLTETGSLTAAQLTGSTTGATTLTGNNQIASLGNFTANSFALNNATDLLIAGAVTTPGTAAFTITGNLTETGSLTAAQLTGSTTGIASLTGNNQIASLGNFTASDFALSNATDLLIAGAVTTPGTAAFTITGNLTETGSLTAAQLTGSTTGIASLTGNNQIASLGNFTASSFALNDATDLLIAGAVATPGTAAFTITGNLTETGSLAAAQLTGSTTGATTLTGNNQIASLGNFTASSLALNDATDLLIAGAVRTPGTAAFSVTGNLTETGSLAAAQLTGSTTGATSLTGNNQIASLGNFTASNFALSNAADLLIAGAVATPGTAAFTITGNLTETGSLAAAQLTGSTTGATTLTGNNQIASLGNFTASNFALNDATDLLIAGAVTTPGIAAFTITGNLTETGSLATAQLTGSTTGTAGLTGNNQIASLGNFTASSFALNDATDLQIAGAVTTPGTAAFTIAGNLTETGSLTAAQLTGSTTGATTLTGNNQIASLGNFTASSFALNNATDLLIAGELNAPNISILAPASQISLGDGATIVTTNALLQSVNFAQLGTSMVLGQGGGPATLQISTTGIQQFDPPLGLLATGATLILDLHGGFAAGAVFVNALDVRFTTPGGTNLTGTIGGIVGGPAAAAGHIQPAVNSAYLFNGCIIGAPTCGTTPVNAGLTATLGAIEPLVALAPPTLTSVPGLILVALPMLQARPPQLTDPDVVPPNITYLDY